MSKKPNTPLSLSEDAHGGKVERDRDRLLNLVLAQFCDVFIALDAAGRVSDIRGNVQAVMQRAARQLEGQVLWEAIPPSEFPQKIQAAIQTQQFERVSGQLLPGGGWIEVLINPDPPGVELFIRNLAAYQQEQDHGRAGAEKGRILFNALLENIPEGIIIADQQDASILILSDYGAQNLAIPRAELLHQSFQRVLERVTFFREDGVTPIPDEEHPLNRALRSGDRSEDEGMVMGNAKNEMHHISSKYGPIHNEDGEIIAGIFSWMNIGERVQAQQQLEDLTRRLANSNQSLETFVYSASHDLQEPLRKIIGFSNVLNRLHANKLEGEAADLVNRMHNAALRMQTMIDSLLNYSRLSARSPVVTTVNLNSVLQQVLQDLEVRVNKTGARVRVEVLPNIRGDQALIENLFQNLVGNAIKFHRPDTPPEVHIYAVKNKPQAARMVRIAVEDNGIGFDVQDSERIFEPFQRLHGKSTYEGTGLGLAICKKIAELHGGQITVSSQPGQGSTFWVDLPEEKR